MCEKRCANCISWDRNRDHDHPLVELKTGVCTFHEIGERYDEFFDCTYSVFEETDENHVCDDHEFEELIAVRNEFVNPDFRNYVIPQRTVSKGE